MLTIIELITCLYPMQIMPLTKDWQKVFSKVTINQNTNMYILNAANATYSIHRGNYETVFLKWINTEVNYFLCHQLNVYLLNFSVTLNLYY